MGAATCSCRCVSVLHYETYSTLFFFCRPEMELSVVRSLSHLSAMCTNVSILFFFVSCKSFRNVSFSLSKTKRRDFSFVCIITFLFFFLIRRGGGGSRVRIETNVHQSRHSSGLPNPFLLKFYFFPPTGYIAHYAADSALGNHNVFFYRSVLFVMLKALGNKRRRCVGTRTGRSV